MTKILVTGAGGFIGFQLCHHLANLGYAVVGIDLHFPKTSETLPFTAVKGDFRDPAVIAEALTDTSVVFHLASAHLSINLSDDEYWDINVHSLPNLLARAEVAGVKRFIHVSSVGAFGNLAQWPADENSPCNPQSIYGETKLAGEAVVLKHGQDNNFPVVVIRPAWVYGATCPRLNKLFQALKKGQFFFIGASKNMRHPIYIKDMLAAFELAMDETSAIGEMFIIGGEESLETRRLIHTICKVFNLKFPSLKMPFFIGKAIALGVESVFSLTRLEPPFSRRTLEFFTTNNAFDIQKAKKQLGFQPAYDFQAGLQDCAEQLIQSKRQISQHEVEK